MNKYSSYGNFAKTNNKQDLTAERHTIPLMFQVVKLWPLKRIQKKCLSDHGQSVAIYAQNILRYDYAHAARLRSKPSWRGSLRSKPRIFAYVACGFVGVDFPHPNGGDRQSSSNPSPRPTNTQSVNYIFQWNIG